MIYLDHNATTPLDPQVLDAMLPYLRESYANASSLHRGGRAARAAIDTARDQVADLVGAHPSQVLFTGGGTEANNLAIKGLAARLRPGRMLISAVEHPAVIEPAHSLRAQGWRVDSLAVDGDGVISVDALERELAAGDVRLVAAMAANNETGTLQPVAELAAAARAADALFHCDAVQAAGKVALRYPDTGAHSLSLSAHKIHGPKGVGALVLDKGLDIAALLHGGGHERGLRGGTENTAAIVGFGAAAELAVARRETQGAHVQALRDRLENGLAAMPGIRMFSQGARRLPNTCQFAVAGFEGESLLMALDGHGIAVSSGSACASGSTEPSHVLLAMGVDADVARGAIRVSLGRDNTVADIDTLLSVLQQLTAGGARMPRINPAVLG